MRVAHRILRVTKRPKAGVTHPQDLYDSVVSLVNLLSACTAIEDANDWIDGHYSVCRKSRRYSKNIKVNCFLPPLREQERIAEILTSVDDSIRATEAVIVQVERMKRGVIEDLLTGGLGSEAITRGEMPEGLEFQRTERNLLNVVASMGLHAPKSDGTIPAFRAM